MAAELETYMLTDYSAGQRNLGAIYLHAEREYWEHHIGDPELPTTIHRRGSISDSR